MDQWGEGGEGVWSSPKYDHEILEQSHTYQCQQEVIIHNIIHYPKEGSGLEKYYELKNSFKTQNVRTLIHTMRNLEDLIKKETVVKFESENIILWLNTRFGED